MFLLQDLPSEKTFLKFKNKYKELDPTSVACFLRLLKTGSNLLVWLDGFLADYQISHGKWIILILLERSERDSETPSELARMQGVTKPTITRLLQGLEADGFITISDQDHDQRKKEVRITSKGRKKLDQIMPHYYREVSKKFQALENDRIKKAIQFLDQIQLTFEEGRKQK